MDFWQNGLRGSKMELRVLFTSIKRNIFQKVAFYTNQTHLKGWLFSKRDFWAKKVETNGHLVLEVLTSNQHI